MAVAYDDLSDDDRERFGRMRDESLKGAKEYSQSWPDPVALPEGLSPVQPFVAEMLPDNLGPWVLDISERRLRSRLRARRSRRQDRHQASTQDRLV